MATIPRTYILTTKEKALTYPLKNGQIIAAYDSDAVWYDAPDNGATTGNPVRRKISGIRVVTSLPESPMEGILYVLTETGKTLPYKSDNPVYEIYTWISDTSSWILVGANYVDENVKSSVASDAWLSSKPIYLTGSIEVDTEVGPLLKTDVVYIDFVNDRITLHVPYVDGLAKEAIHADNADNADKADKDKHDNAITSYVKGITSDYSGGAPCTTITVTDGDGHTTSIQAKDTQYGIFNSNTAGLVAGSGTNPSNKILTGTGWVNTDEITIGTAGKAIGDKNGKDITEYLANASGNNGENPATQLIFTRGDNSQKTIQIKTYNRFSASEDGVVAKASGAGDNLKFLRGDNTWQNLPEFTGTDAGVVPASGDASKYLAGDGNWKSAFVAATSSTAGTVGLVPAPTTDDVNKVLSNEGWVINGTSSTANADPTRPLYLVGASVQSAGNESTQTYSEANVRILNGKLYQSDDSATPVATQVVDLTSAQALTNKTYEGYNLDSACSYPVTDDIYPNHTDTFTGDGSKVEFNFTQDVATVTEVTIDNEPTTAYSIVECEDYADSIPYAVGAYCIYEDAQEIRNIYRCNTAITTPESWDETHWTLVVSDIASPDLIVFTSAPGSNTTISVDYTALASGTLPTSDAVSTFVAESIATVVDIANNHVNNEVVANYYDETHSYSIGNFCMFMATGDDYAKLYKCRQATSGTTSNPEDFDPTKWTATTIMQAILDLIPHS